MLSDFYPLAINNVFFSLFHQIFSHKECALKHYRIPIYSTFILLFVISPGLALAQQTVTYTYDALGRLTFVQDSLAGNRDYDYDKAGNRLLVSVNTASDAAAEPSVPSAPTGLQSNHYADCVHRASWNASVSSAPGLYYFVRETRDAGKVTTDTTIFIQCDRGYPNSNKPRSVKACNVVGCSLEVNFPN